MKTFTTLTIGFENCETITFSSNEVAAFSVQEITKGLYNDWYSSNIKEFQTSTDTTIILLPDANKHYEEGSKEIDTTFKRILKYNDITDITIMKNDSSFEHLSMYWEKEDEYSNRYQTTSILSDGSLVIVISKKENAEDLKKMYDEKIKKIDEENDTLKKSIDETHGRWVKVYGYATAGGDPVYKCSKCGLDEHVYGIEHNEKHIVCKNCGSMNIYPWEK